MRISLTFFCLLFLFGSCTKTTFYIVRHAEKATAAPNMSSDVPLTEAGQQRAIALKDLLAKKKIQSVFSTQTIRTTSTAKPLAELKGIAIQPYNHKDTLDKFISRLKAVRKGAVLVVGHSNTVDDLVNKMMGQNVLTDLPDSEYDNLFIVKRKGNKYLFERKKY